MATETPTLYRELQNKSGAILLVGTQTPGEFDITIKDFDAEAPTAEYTFTYTIEGSAQEFLNSVAALNILQVLEKLGIEPYPAD